MEKFIEYASKIKWLYVVGAVVALGGLSYTQLDFSALEQLKIELQTTNRTIGTLNRKIKETKRFEKELESQQQELKKLQAELRSKRGNLKGDFNIPALLEELFREAELIGLEVVSIRPDNKENKYELYSSKVIFLNIRGTFLQTFVFLDRLSKIKSLVGVSSLTLGTDSSRESVSLKGTAGLNSSSKIVGKDKVFTAVTGNIEVLAYRIL